MEVLKISSKSNPNSVAGAIAGLIKESQKAEMQAIGAGALNQAVKAVGHLPVWTAETLKEILQQFPALKLADKENFP